jgi:DNA-binding response OmpR family regulator
MEYGIVLYLVQHQGAMCRSSRLVAALMGVEESDSLAGARLRSHILRIRRHLRAIEPGQEPISNVRGIGYRLDAPPEPGPGA